jgi:two-component SAPR family response regulator
MRVVIIDDEWFGIDLVEKVLLGLEENIEIVGTFQDPMEAIPYLLARTPDLIILDAEMPFINGLDMVRMLLHTGAFFIIITAHDIRALERNHPLDRTTYLSKPFSVGELRKIILAIKANLSHTNQNE